MRYKHGDNRTQCGVRILGTQAVFQLSERVRGNERDDFQIWERWRQGGLAVRLIVVREVEGRFNTLTSDALESSFDDGFRGKIRLRSCVFESRRRLQVQRTRRSERGLGTGVNRIGKID